jgi:hypothetical protein
MRVRPYKSMMLSPNFNIDEIVSPNYIDDLTSSQYEMLEHLCFNVLEPMRYFAHDLFGIDCPITITSGLRTMSDYYDLIRAGYRPSQKSDHFFGAVPETCGAVDLCLAKDTDTFFWALAKTYKNGMLHIRGEAIDFGQIILEKNKTFWVHVSNPGEIFGIKKRTKNKIMVSIDNGKTYKNV